ncbi:MAG: hypothetical protein ABJM67_14490, partial [Rhodopirellula bahusiensis]
MNPAIVFRTLPLIAALLTTTLAGCAAKLAHIDTARNAFASGDPDTAREVLSKVADGGGRFATPAKLDLAMVDLAVGDATSAEKTLRELRDEFDASLKVAPL